MSASDTKIEKQTKHHKPSLLGIAAAVALAVVACVAILMWGFGDDVDDAASVEPAAVTQPATD
ncbi:hypothetical protein [Sulfitobacter sp. DFL-23]|jgi:hypothetical protein|uniref:Uncharacterized protein n=1 Tax=Pseudosulfitobacter pseudonitzschiae TaxID=1402135 RepID=A0A221K143_9RHOB|nr:hypothetical protein [Sulfitobacter sp. DFL-23]ASM72718.1 hypothetical protein SULPSESMR1_01910 [Pseudosulfitobacter pseudonitzschiae]